MSKPNNQVNNTKEKVESITIRLCEEQTLWIVRDSIVLDVNEYPELDGKTEEEIKEYINENSQEMSAPDNFEWADSLYDALSQQDVIREKETGHETSIYFE